MLWFDIGLKKPPCGHTGLDVGLKGVVSQALKKFILDGDMCLPGLSLGWEDEVPALLVW